MFDNDRRSHHGKRTGSWLGARKAHLNLLSFHENYFRIILHGTFHVWNMLLSILSLKILLRKRFPPHCVRDSKFFNAINQMPSPWSSKIYFSKLRTLKMCWDALSVPLMIFFISTAVATGPEPKNLCNHSTFSELFTELILFIGEKLSNKYLLGS